jgi:hypothetical protein
LARRVLSLRRCASLLVVLWLVSCRREQRAPAPNASASAAGVGFTDRARDAHFQQELTRANSRWQAKPSVGDCSLALKEKADLELCQAAESSLAAITGAPAATPESALEPLAKGALALARLCERLRYLSLAELAERRVDGGAAPAPSGRASGAVPGALSAVSHAHGKQHVGHAEQRAIEQGEGRVSQQLALATRLERDVIRNIGAYLEYGPLPVRRAAFTTVEHLRAEHPRWASLDHLLREASVLEVNEDLKRDLRRLTGEGSRSPQKPEPETDQPTGTK